MGSRCFVFGDVHGCAATLRRLIEDQLAPARGDRLYFLGDLVDRGPGSREVLDYLQRLRDEGYAVAAVRGNHEQMLLDACRDRDAFRLWLLNGGGATLAGFGVEDACDIPVPYRRFLAEFPPYLLLDGFVLVHGCLNFTVADPFSETETMLWGRSCVVDLAKTGSRLLITGHTPVRRATVEASLAEDRILLDNGCVYRGYPGLGALVALELTTQRLFFGENCETA